MEKKHTSCLRSALKQVFGILKCFHPNLTVKTLWDSFSIYLHVKAVSFPHHTIVKGGWLEPLTLNLDLLLLDIYSSTRLGGLRHHLSLQT